MLTDEELAALIPNGLSGPGTGDHSKLIERLIAQAREANKLRAELAESKLRVLTPLSSSEVESALHEGRAEAMASTGDNAWTSLIKQRDAIAAEANKLRAENAEEKELDDMGHYCIEQHVEYKRRRNEQHDAYDALHAVLQNVLASAYPNERDHPTMSRAWQRARAFLARAAESNVTRPGIGPAATKEG